jgi:hypothetical protein
MFRFLDRPRRVNEAAAFTERKAVRPSVPTGTGAGRARGLPGGAAAASDGIDRSPPHTPDRCAGTRCYCYAPREAAHDNNSYVQKSLTRGSYGFQGGSVALELGPGGTDEGEAQPGKASFRPEVPAPAL